MIIFHITVAILSVIVTSVAWAAVSRWALRGAYVGTVLTLLSGMYLVWVMPAQMMHLCVAGVIYLTLVSAGIAAARYRIAKTHKAAIHR